MDTTTEAVEDHLNAAMLNEVEYGVTVDLLRALAVERDALAAQLAELRPTEGAPDEAETFACTLDSRGTPWASGCASLMRQMASELRGYRKAVTWGVDTVAEAYRLDAEKLEAEASETHEKLLRASGWEEREARLEAANAELRERDAAATEYMFAGVGGRRYIVSPNWPKDLWFVAEVSEDGERKNQAMFKSKEETLARARTLAAGEVK